MKKIFVLALAMLVYNIANAKPTIFLIGDSTCAEFKEDREVKGWGQKLNMFFNSNVSIVNCARSGRSSKSYIDQGHWNKCISQVNAGDFVFVSFAHNDGKQKDSLRYAAPYGLYSENLKRFAEEAREKGATPIFVTSVNRRKFSGGNPVRTLGEYPAAMRVVGQELNVPVLDIEELSWQFLCSNDEETVKQYYVTTDHSHLNAKGAELVAKMVAEQVKAKRIKGLSKYVKL